jgi:hypothetical protein
VVADSHFSQQAAHGDRRVDTRDIREDVRRPWECGRRPDHQLVVVERPKHLDAEATPEVAKLAFEDCEELLQFWL